MFVCVFVCVCDVLKSIETEALSTKPEMNNNYLVNFLWNCPLDIQYTYSSHSWIF